ncbi:arginine-hydroxylase NDUFAF5, mitochondrial [Hippoglossus hippoglossus]|uniref:arginine-hydroxylase NDUFAF5, mitochondrial n=1 Tax=Hippoglossus hippoglossus TaxID=8267 RepID=UPI00148C3B84|nr:arginine-hydroxylase NDUFAF5, mitochondrial [Hippoglossus hippoglossus]
MISRRLLRLLTAASPAPSPGSGSRLMSASGRGSMNVFDREMKRRQRRWAGSLQDTHLFDYLRDEVGGRVADRVYDIARTFPLALDIGGGKSHIAEHLSKDVVERLFLTDVSEKTLRRRTEIPTHCVLADEEFLPFLLVWLVPVISDLLVLMKMLDEEQDEEEEEPVLGLDSESEISEAEELESRS